MFFWAFCVFSELTFPTFCVLDSPFGSSFVFGNCLLEDFFVFPSGLFSRRFSLARPSFRFEFFSPLALVYFLSFGLYLKGVVHVFSPSDLKGFFTFFHHQEALSPGLVVFPTDPTRLVQSLS